MRKVKEMYLKSCKEASASIARVKLDTTPENFQAAIDALSRSINLMRANAISDRK